MNHFFCGILWLHDRMEQSFTHLPTLMDLIYMRVTCSCDPQTREDKVFILSTGYSIRRRRNSSKFFNPDSVPNMTCQAMNMDFLKAPHRTHICHIPPCAHTFFLKIHASKKKRSKLSHIHCKTLQSSCTTFPSCLSISCCFCLGKGIQQPLWWFLWEMWWGFM